MQDNLPGIVGCQYEADTITQKRNARTKEQQLHKHTNLFAATITQKRNARKNGVRE